MSPATCALSARSQGSTWTRLPSSAASLSSFSVWRPETATVAPCLWKRAGDGAADAARGARDERRLVGQVEHGAPYCPSRGRARRRCPAACRSRRRSRTARCAWQAPPAPCPSRSRTISVTPAGRHGGDALAPAHGARDLLDQAALDLDRVADRRCQSRWRRAVPRAVLTSTLASASAMASAAGCISAQWKGALTLSGMKRRTPCALASCAARSMALLAPEMTAWVGSLSLASWHTSPSRGLGGELLGHLLADAQQGRHRALADRHSACMAWPRVCSRRAASATDEGAGSARAPSIRRASGRRRT